MTEIVEKSILMYSFGVLYMAEISTKHKVSVNNHLLAQQTN